MDQLDNLNFEQYDFSNFLEDVKNLSLKKNKNYLILLSEHQPLFYNYLKKKINAKILDISLSEDSFSYSNNILNSLIFDKSEQIFLVDLFENKKEKLDFIKKNKDKNYILFSPVKIDVFETLDASSNLTKTLFKNLIVFFDLNMSSYKQDKIFKVFEKNKSFNLDEIFIFSQQLSLVSSVFLSEFLLLVEQAIFKKNVFSLTDSILKFNYEKFFHLWFVLQDSFTEQFWSNFFQNFIWKSLSSNFRIDLDKEKRMLRLCEKLYTSDFFSKKYGLSNQYILIFSDFFFDL